MAMRRVTYGGIEFEIVKVNRYQHRPRMSEDQTEILYIETHVDLTMIFNPAATSYAGSGGEFAAVQGAGPGATDVALRLRLMTPRLQFYMEAPDGTPLLVAPAAGYDRDLDNGPKPQGCAVTDMGYKTWRVQWSVVVATKDCGSAAADYPILSNRWSQSQETGLDRLCRLSTRGITVFRPDVLANINRSADFYREACVPACPLGYQRQHISATVTPSGTSLAWQVIDQEMMVSIGDSTDPRRMDVEGFEAVFTLQSGAQDPQGVPTNNLIAQFDGSAFGAKTASRANLLGWLAKLAIERCAIPGGPVDPQKQPIILSVRASEHIDKPQVSYSVTMQFPPPPINKAGFGPLRVDFLGIDLINLFSNDGKSPQMPQAGNTRGTSNAVALAAAIKDNCSAIPNPPSAYDSSPGDANSYIQTSTPTIDIDVSGEIPEYASGYSEGATSLGTYSEYRIQTRYKTKTGKMACPVAGQVTNNYGSTSGPTDDSDSDVEVLTMGRPMTELIVQFEAERSMVAPILPNPKSSDDNLVLLDEDISPMAVGVMGDGISPVYRVGGTLRYILKKSRQPGTTLNFPCSPMLNFDFGGSFSAMSTDYYTNGTFDSSESESDSGTASASQSPQ